MTKSMKLIVKNLEVEIKVFEEVDKDIESLI